MKLNLIVTYIFMATVLFGCGEDFLDTEPTEFISSRQLDEIAEYNPEVQAGNVLGLYSLMFSVESGGTTGHDDFGQRGYDIYSDMLSSDMVLGNQIYGWYSGLSDLQSTTDYTSNRNYMPWRYYYRIIQGANRVIDVLGGTDAEPDTDGDRYVMGQAKAMRAYAYFYLANFFAERYEPADLIIPIYTNSIDTDNKPLSSTEDVYELIVSDLTTAVTYLEGFSRSGKYEVDVNVARGLLAYAYAAAGEYESAASTAKEVIDEGGYSILPMDEVTTNGFNDVSSSNWIWGIDITLDMGLDLVSWWGQVDLFTYSYAWAGDGKIIHQELYEAIPADDARKSQFIDAYGNGKLYPINKFFDPGRAIGGQRSITSDYVYMRIEEMYLLHAENAARSNDEPAARASLREFLAERVPDPSYVDALSGQALLDEIILQTRIELWGEGKSYLSMKRNELTITLGSNHLTYPGLAVPFDDDRLTFDIPQSEIQNNPNINL